MHELGRIGILLSLFHPALVGFMVCASATLSKKKKNHWHYRIPLIHSKVFFTYNEVDL